MMAKSVQKQQSLLHQLLVELSQTPSLGYLLLKLNFAQFHLARSCLVGTCKLTDLDSQNLRLSLQFQGFLLVKDFILLIVLLLTFGHLFQTVHILCY